MGDHAERNEPFIRYFLEKISGNVLDVQISGVDLKTLPDYGGLYVFYVKFNPTNKERYPIYVGMTRRTFRERFREHASDGGVIDVVSNGRFPRNYHNLGLHAYLVKMDGITSKLVESVLLEAFNFCLNSDENGSVRQDLDIAKQYPPEDSKADFEISWKNIVDRVKEIDVLYAK